MNRSMEVVDSGVTLQVALQDNPDDEPNRLVIYDWFTRVGSPPRAGNDVEVLVDGEQTWTRVFNDLELARERVQVATWMLRASHEMVRPEELGCCEPADRADFRFGALIDRLADRGVDIRLLIWGGAYTPILNRWLRRWYWRPQTHIELLEQDHPRLIGSHHQKTFTIDSRVGYCGGMNVKENDWDTCAHAVREPRRNPHGTKAAFRTLVRDGKKPAKFAPRHDLTLRIEGPVVHDLESNFQQRWNQSVRARRASLPSRFIDMVRRWFGNRAYTYMRAPETLQPEMGDRWVQVVRTTPGGEEGILDAYRRAIANARKYIYIENQYFRSPIIGEAIARAIARNPHLRLAVVAWPINDGKKSFWDPSGYWTAKTQDLIRTQRPDFKLTRVMVYDRDYVQIDVHAKVMVIDDVWLTVGSANINDRGFKYEAEINSVILDDRDARDLRLRLMAEHLEVPMDEAEARLGDIDAAFDLWEEHGEENARRKAAGEAPSSRVIHFRQEGPGRPPFGVGQGVF